MQDNWFHVRVLRKKEWNFDLYNFGSKDLVRKIIMTIKKQHKFGMQQMRQDHLHFERWKKQQKIENKNGIDS